MAITLQEPEVSPEAQARLDKILERPTTETPKKTRTTAGRLRAKFEALIDRDETLIAEHKSKISTLQLRLDAWGEAIAEINSEVE